ncbi:MAG: alpha/beta hydrolase [Anaerolineales bacterium]|nr:alpha/beta hydrolase [Anaerolineales bacterium]
MTSDIIQAWSAKGTRLNIPGTASTHIWRQGNGPTVVCLHGVPSSAYLYRKVLPELASRGLEGVALDLPGMGLADRPENFDYTWTGLSAWLEKALNAAKIDKFHLVVHDLGGPVGFDLIRRIPERILSLTVLNTLVKVDGFKKPWVMRPFTVPVLGYLWSLQMNSPIIFPFFHWKGILAGPSYTEIRAYGELLMRDDGGKAFRKIMGRFETTREFEERILLPLRDRKFPAQIIWGKYDTELSLKTQGADLKRVLNLQAEIHEVEGKHFLQENRSSELADRISLLVKTGKDI